MTIPLSVLDLVPIAQGATPMQAIANSRDLAQHVEALGYARYWLAEHHNMDGLACSATSVLVGHIAAATKTIHVGSGGIMLPNHAPLVVAEQFGTLATIYPGRIELGIGRAPGTDRATMRALRRHLNTDEEEGFVRDLVELAQYFAPPSASPAVVRAIPGVGCDVPIWLLGSSTYSAQVAAMLGLPFAFASHFAPALLMPALTLYREHFTPGVLASPHVMVAVNVCAADSETEALSLFTSVQQRFLGIVRDQRGPLPPPVASMDMIWSASERMQVERMLQVCAVGTGDQVKSRLREITSSTGANELILTSNIFDHAARKHSFALAMGA